MTKEFDYAAWRLEQYDDPTEMEKILTRLEERTVIGKQIAECKRLLAEAKGKTSARPELD